MLLGECVTAIRLIKAQTRIVSYICTDTDMLISNVDVYLKFNKSSLSTGKDVISKLELYIRLAKEYDKVVTSQCWCVAPSDMSVN